MGSLQERVVLAALKKVRVHPLLKRLFLDPEIPENYNSIVNISFLGKMLKSILWLCTCLP